MLKNDCTESNGSDLKKVTAKKSDKKKNNIHPDVVNMLSNWGMWNRVYEDGLYPHENIIYQLTKNNKGKSIDFIDDEIEVIETIIHEFRQSIHKRQRIWYQVLKYYYIGNDILENGSKFYQKLSDAKIANIMNCSQKTINNLRREAESEISRQIFDLDVDITKNLT